MPALNVSLGEPISTDVPIERLNIFPPIRCDEEGRMYIRVIGPLPPRDSGRSAPTTLYRIAPDGRTTAFEFDKMPDTAGKDVVTFAHAIDRDGDVHAAVRTMEMKKDGVTTLYIASFSSDGKYRGRFEVDKNYRPKNLVALSNGNFFLSGMYGYPNPKSEAAAHSFTVLLDSSGRLLKDMKRASDDAPPKDDTAKMPLITNSAIEMGDAWEGPDGFLYLYRGGTPTRVELFTQDGSFVKTIVLHSPVPEYKVDLLSVTPGRVWVAVANPTGDKFGGMKLDTVVVYNLLDGEPISTVNITGIKAILACGANDELLFLKATSTGKYALLRGKVGR